MQNIPRNELLDKLAAGWKVRRKSWRKEFTISESGDSVIIQWCELLKDDWEGKPPGPVRMYESCAITFAFEKLRDGAAFIRRPDWDGPITRKSLDVNISVDDILANDWEVWG